MGFSFAFAIWSLLIGLKLIFNSENIFYQANTNEKKKKEKSVTKYIYIYIYIYIYLEIIIFYTSENKENTSNKDDTFSKYYKPLTNFCPSHNIKLFLIICIYI